MPDEHLQRQAVVAEARKWVGTPYHPCGDSLGVGVDCGMLLVRVFVDTGLSAPIDPRPYSQEWHLHRSEEKYLGFVTPFAAEVDTVGLGDIVVFKYGRCYAHGAIVTAISPLWIVHAFSPLRRVVEEKLRDNAMLMDPTRMPRFFSHWATNEHF
jgi:cell wall-associated NlpC family hydrolase